MTLGRLRLLVRRTGRRLGPVLVTVTAVAAAGLGLHGALDWHRHGEPGVGFFHLHVHFGEHEHPDIPRGQSADGSNPTVADLKPGLARVDDHCDRPALGGSGAHRDHHHHDAGHAHHDHGAGHSHDHHEAEVPDHHREGGDEQVSDEHHGGLDPHGDLGVASQERAGGGPAEPAPPEPDPPAKRRHAGVLTLALGVAPAPATATVAGPALEATERAPVAAHRLADRPSERCAWSPRGPPA